MPGIGEKEPICSRHGDTVALKRTAMKARPTAAMDLFIVLSSRNASVAALLSALLTRPRLLGLEAVVDGFTHPL
jgi:hypothetical protein